MPADKSLKDLSNAVYKIAENSPKIQKDVKDIRDAICGSNSNKGILEYLSIISENIKNEQKKNITSKTLGNKSNDVNTKKILKGTSSIEFILKNILGTVNNISNKGIRGGRILNRIQEGRIGIKSKDLESMSRSIGIIESLRNIKLKDFISTKIKMKSLSKIMMRARDLFKTFKNKKEAENTISFVNSSIDIIKKLGKVWIISKPAQWGIKSIEKIFLGSKKGGGLLEIFRNIVKNKKQIKEGKQTTKDIFKSCGSFLLTTMILTGIAALSVPAMIGALLMKGVIYLLIGTYKVLSVSSRQIKKGSVTLLIMSTSVVAFALGLGMMVKAVRGMKIKDIGLMVASIAGVGLAVAGIGLLAIPIAIGSASLLLIGASIGVLGLALKSWKSIDAKSSIENIKTTIGGLKDALGLNFNESTDGRGFGSKLKSAGGEIMGFMSSIFEFGKTFFQMGSILLAVVTIGLIRKSLLKWNNFNPGNAIDNIKTTLGGIKEVLGIGTNEPQELNKKGMWNQLKGVGSDIMGFASVVLQFGKSFFQVGSILLGVGIMGFVRKSLDEWKDYDPGNASDNIRKTLVSIKDALGIGINEPEKLTFGGFFRQVVGSASDVFGLASSILQMGKTFFQMGSILLGMGMMNTIREHLDEWKNYDSGDAIKNIKNTLSELKGAMGLINDAKTEETNEKNTVEDDVKWYKKIGERLKNTSEKITNAVSGAVNGIKSMTKLTEMIVFTSAMAEIKESLNTYSDDSSSNAIGNIRNTITDLLSIAKNDNVEKSNVFKKISDNIKNGLSSLNVEISIFDKTSNHIKNGLKDIKKGFDNLQSIQNIHKPIDNTVKSINMLDLERASVMTDMFKSFAKIGNKPFDKFTNAVNKFVKSCGELIESMDKLSESNESENVTQEIITNNSTGSSKSNGSFYIENTKDLAQAIAEAIKSLPINVENNMSDIRLVVDGTSGKKVILSLE